MITRELRPAVRVGSVMVVGAALMVGLLAGEGAVRLLWPDDNVRTTATLAILAPDSELGWVLKPDIRVRIDWAGRGVLIRTDGQGHRVPDVGASKTSEARIATAGDSFVFGNEVDAEGTFVHLVGQASRKGSVNLGVPGYSMSQASLALRRLLSRRRGLDHAILLIYVGNDVAGGPYPSNRYVVDEHGHLGHRSSGRWREIRHFAVHHSRLMFELQYAWRRRSADTGRGSIYDKTAFSRDRLDDHRRVLVALRDDPHLRGVTLTVVLMPERNQVYASLGDHPNRMISAMLSELGIRAVDLLPSMRSAAATHPPFWNDMVNGHLSVAGHRFVADVLMDQVGEGIGAE